MATMFYPRVPCLVLQMFYVLPGSDDDPLQGFKFWEIPKATELVRMSILHYMHMYFKFC